MAAATPATADVVTEWNEIAETAAATAGAPPFRARVMAIVQIAVHDALNAIEPRYASYSTLAPAAPGASEGAAVATAAYRAIAQLLPAQGVALQVTYANRIVELPDCTPGHPACIADGIAAGEAAAAAILARRANDGSATPHLPYTLAPSVGVYQVTPAPPPPTPAVQFAGWAHVTPFALHSGSQFRADPSPIFDLTSEAYTRDYDEVKRVGSATATVQDRTADQSEIARFWPAAGASWNWVARILAAGRGLDEREHARLFALLNMAISDSAVSVFDTKYTYNFWRPVTAIRAGDTDGNPATAADPAWASFQPTPRYPDYTCGLTTNAGAAIDVLRRQFGDVPYTFTAGGLTRTFTSLSHAGDESIDARVFGGMHFRDGCVRGLKIGEKVGHFTVQHVLKPLKGRKQ